jgi:hypothetical protein
LLFVFFATVVSAQQDHTALKSGEIGGMRAKEYLDFSDREQQIYSMGYVDGMFLSVNLDAHSNRQRLAEVQSCVGTRLDAEYFAAAIRVYIAKKPDKWDWSLTAAAYNAMLLEACPKK